MEKQNNKIVNTLGKFLMIPKEDLQIDYVYQRTKVTNKKTLKISKKWSWFLCGSLSVTKRKGIYFVVDGQHRKLAADKRDDISVLPCLVYKSKGVASEAQAFYDKNTSKSAVLSGDKFRALLVAGNKHAIAVNKLMESSDYSIGSRTRNKVISCGMLLIKDHERDPKITEELWHLCVNIVGEHPQGIHSNIWSGLFYLELQLRKQNKSVFNPKIKKRLLASGRAGFIEAISNAKRYYMTGGPNIFAKGILQIINYRVQEHNCIQI